MSARTEATAAPRAGSLAGNWQQAGHGGRHPGDIERLALLLVLLAGHLNRIKDPGENKVKAGC